MKKDVQVLITLEWEDKDSAIDTLDGVKTFIRDMYEEYLDQRPKSISECYPKLISSRIKEEAEIYETENLNLRPALKWFAELQEAKLRDNDYKGGWVAMRDEELFHHMNRANVKLVNLIADLHRVTTLREAGSSIKKECVDIANYAMMIADIHGNKIGK